MTERNRFRLKPPERHRRPVQMHHREGEPSLHRRQKPTVGVEGQLVVKRHRENGGAGVLHRQEDSLGPCGRQGLDQLQGLILKTAQRRGNLLRGLPLMGPEALQAGQPNRHKQRIEDRGQKWDGRRQLLAGPR